MCSKTRGTLSHASKITNSLLSTLNNTAITSRAHEPSHFLKSCFTLLTSGCRYRPPLCKKTQTYFKVSFSWSLWCPSKLLLSLVPQMGPCRGRGHDRNCSGGRWPLAGCRSYTGHETGHRPKTLRRPRGAGGLSLACSSGSLCCRPVKGPEQTTKCKRVSCKSWKVVQSAERKITSTWELCKFLSNIPGRRIW